MYFGMVYILFLVWISSINSIESSTTCDQKQHIYSAIIASQVPGKTYIEHRIFDHVKRFRKHAFAGYPDIDGEMQLWTPIYAYDCQGNDTTYSKGRGSNLVHREVWDSFYRHRRPCGIEQNDVMMIFEYDAFLGSKHASDIVMNAVRKMTTDILLLGYCYRPKTYYDPKVSGRAPYCLHAYAVTLTGAKKLVELLDVCGGFADLQIATYADAKLLSWSYLNESYDHSYLQQLFDSEGIHFSGYFNYGGVVIQGKFDEAVPSLQEGTLSNTSPHGRQIFCLLNQTWRAVGSMDHFNKLKLPGNDVLILSPWQFHQYKFNKMAAPLTDEEVVTMAEIIKQRSSHKLL